MTNTVEALKKLNKEDLISIAINLKNKMESS